MKSFKIVNEIAVVQGRQITVSFLLVNKCTGEVVLAKGVAKCSPEDKFNFQTGRDLAFQRAFDKAMGKLIKSTQKLSNKLYENYQKVRQSWYDMANDGLDLLSRYEAKVENEPEEEPEEKIVHED